MKTSKRGLDLIKKYEGVRLQAYKCPAGVWTIGYGHTKSVRQGDKISQYQADDYLLEDIRFAENAVNNLNINLTQGQFDALVSFIFNVGVGNFLKSTLYRKVKANPKDKTIPSEFRKWVYAGGAKLAGLIRRREEEARLYVS